MWQPKTDRHAQSDMNKASVDHQDDSRPCCAQCRTKMKLNTVEPDPKRADKELHTYVCGGCGLLEIIEMPL
jgi:hypothetical protein